MNLEERRNFHQTHNPVWPLKAVVSRTKNPLNEAMVGASRAFVLAYAGKASMGIVFGLLGGKKGILSVLKEALGRDTLRFSIFFAVYNGILRGVANQICRMRNGVNDRLNAVVAGIVASFALLLDDVERRRTVSIYVFVRAISVMVKELSREGILPYSQHAESILFGVVNMPIMYGFLLEPEILDKGYYKWILGMGNISHEGLDTALRARYRDYIATGSFNKPFCTCQPHYHQGSCLGYCTYDWFLGLGRACKVYAPVHLVPLLVFRYRKLLEKPQQQLTETAMGLLYSCMFLTTYQFTVKFSQCTLRNIRQTDDLPAALLSGLLTGFSCLFERPSRVSELMLYCVPKSLEACWNYSTKYLGFRSVPYFELGLFMFGNSVLVAALKEDLKSTYFNVAEFLVTTSFNKKEGQKKLKNRQPPTLAAAEEQDKEEKDSSDNTRTHQL